MNKRQSVKRARPGKKSAASKKVASRKPAMKKGLSKAKTKRKVGSDSVTASRKNSTKRKTADRKRFERRLVLDTMMAHWVPCVGQALLQDQSFCARYGIETARTLRIGDAELRVDKFLKDLAAAHSNGSPPAKKRIKDSIGPFSTKEGDDGSVSIEVGNRGFRFEVFKFLYAGVKERKQVFAQVSIRATLSQRRAEYWSAVLDERVLTIDEYVDLTNELGSSPERMFGNLIARIQAEKHLGGDLLIPESKSTLEAILGDFSKADDFQTYATGALKEQREFILKGDLVRGLSLIGPSYAWSDPHLLSDCSTFPDDAVYSACVELSKHVDIFSLILGLELSASRSDQPRFLELAQSVVQKVVSEELAHRAYDHSISLIFILGDIANRAEFSDTPVANRRLAAWTCAGFSVRALSQFQFDRKAFCESLSDGTTIPTTFCIGYERRFLPSWRPEQIDFHGILGLLFRRAQMAIDLAPTDELKSVLRLPLSSDDSLKAKGLAYPMQLMPGPLDEAIIGRLPTGLDIPIDVFRDDESAEVALSRMQLVVSYGALPSELMTKILSALDTLLAADLRDCDASQILNCLTALGFLCGVRRDKELAGKVTALISKARRQVRDFTVLAALHFTLDAASAHIEDDEYFAFLEESFGALPLVSASKNDASACLFALNTLSLLHPSMPFAVGRVLSFLELLETQGD